MAQHRPIPAPEGREPDRAPLHVSRGGWHHHVDHRAAETLTSAAADSYSPGAQALNELTDDVSFAEVWDQIGWRGVQAAYADDGHPPRSRSTIYAWTRAARGGRPGKRAARAIPARVAALIQRRAFTARRGGVTNLADELGVSPATVSRWQSGHTAELRGAAADALNLARLHDAQQRAGQPPIRGAHLNVTAGIEYRDGEDAYVEMRRAVRAVALDLDAPTAEALAAALHAGNRAEATAIIEQAWTEEWGTFGGYSDTEGVHLLEVERFDIGWT